MVLRRLLIAAVAGLGMAIAAGSAQAQYYDEDGFDGPPPPPRPVYEPRYRDRYAGPPPGRPVGLNCDALQPGLTGPQPYSCPLPGPRPLGARCFCETPIAPLSGGDTVAGRVVP